ncbi:signal peptidase I [Vallitalea okinawensis]|uniref:signal peptidase I n=1 Tax=Vallitalea okinawensis TaxID=2078660 RepID=UPI000CFD724E|nr:signal peptidase I [Vallitalea okinawensis]
MTINGLIKEISELMLTVITALIIAFFVQAEVLASTEVHESSMENTLFENQRLFIDRVSYKVTSPQRGDIIVFNEESSEGFWSSDIGILLEDYITKFNGEEQRLRYVKRVIGIPGDEVDIRDGKVYINGEISYEAYTLGDTRSRELEFPCTVPENKLLVLGDNREISKDSRDFGLIDFNNIEGKAFIRYWPLDEVDLLN